MVSSKVLDTILDETHLRRIYYNVLNTPYKFPLTRELELPYDYIIYDREHLIEEAIPVSSGD